jgi:hypothetical protein
MPADQELTEKIREDKKFTMLGCFGALIGVLLGAVVGGICGALLFPTSHDDIIPATGLAIMSFGVLGAILGGPIGFGIGWFFQARLVSKENQQLRAELDDLRRCDRRK